MPQFFTAEICTINDTVTLTGKEAHHISNVLRLQKNDWIVLSNGKGRSFKAMIQSIANKEIILLITEDITRHAIANAPSIALSIIRKDRFEWAIQKLIELGCNHIIPLITKRTNNYLNSSNLEKKKNRWQEIALSAAKQSGLPQLPIIDNPVSYVDLISTPQQFNHRIIFYEGEKTHTINTFWQEQHCSKGKTVLIVGPEGGFSMDEISLCEKNAIHCLNLGHQILRVETAAIAALTIWQYNLGNI